MAKPQPQPSDDTNLSNEAAPAVPDTAVAGSEVPVIPPEEPSEIPATASVDDTIAGEDEAAAAPVAPAKASTPSEPLTAVEPKPATFAPVNSFTDGGQPDAPSVTTQPPVKPRLSRRWLLVAIALALLLLIIVGVVWALVGGSLRNHGQAVIDDALVNTLYSGHLSSADFSGSSTFTSNIKKPGYTLDYSGKFGKNGALEVTTDINSSSAKASLELLSVNGQNYYVKADGLTDLPQLLGGVTAGQPAAPINAQELQALQPLLASINNQWYEVNQTVVQNIEQNLGIDVNNLHPNQADAHKIAQLYKQHQFLVVDQRLPDQTVAGLNSYHYRLHVDSAKFKAFMAALEQAKLKSVTLPQNFLTGLAQTNRSRIPFELWISQDSKIVDQVKLSTTGSNYISDSQLTLSQLNQPVSVSAPANPQSFLQLLDQVYQAVSTTNVNTTQLNDVLGNL